MAPSKECQNHLWRFPGQSDEYATFRWRLVGLKMKVDIEGTSRQTRLMPSDLIVLNGPSSAGKSSPIRHLQVLWPRPLYATGIDALIVGWPDNYVLDHDESDQSKETDALHIVAGLGPAP